MYLAELSMAQLQSLISVWSARLFGILLYVQHLRKPGLTVHEQRHCKCRYDCDLPRPC